MSSQVILPLQIFGLSARTKNIYEANPETAKMPNLIHRFLSQDLSNLNPSRMFIVYKDYESNEHGEYTVFVGKEPINTTENINLESYTIPEQQYTKLTSEKGPIPQIVIDVWKTIWSKEISLEGQRTYVADFEVYDERCQDLNNAVMDIYVGVHQSILK